MLSIHACLSAGRPVCLPACLPACLLAWLACLPACLAWLVWLDWLAWLGWLLRSPILDRDRHFEYRRLRQSTPATHGLFGKREACSACPACQYAAQMHRVDSRRSACRESQSRRIPCKANSNTRCSRLQILSSEKNCRRATAKHGRFPKFHRAFLGRDPGTLKSDIVSKKHPQLICSDLRLSN